MLILALITLTGLILLYFPIFRTRGVIVEYTMAFALGGFTVGIVQKKYGLPITKLGYRLPIGRTRASVRWILAASALAGIIYFFTLTLTESLILDIASPFTQGFLRKSYGAWISGALMVPVTPNGFLQVVASPLSEELYFRGFLLPVIEKQLRNTPTAVFIQAIVFGALHADPSRGLWAVNFLEGTLGGLLMGTLFAHYRSIAVSFSCHSATNWCLALFRGMINSP